jgi:uncharacterized protein
MRTIHYLCMVLVIIGAVNWGLVALFQFDLVAALFSGQDAVLSRVVYSLVGLAGIGLAITASTATTNHNRLDYTHQRA